MSVWMEEIIRRINRTPTRVIGTVMFLTSTVSAMNLPIPTLLNEAYHQCKTIGKSHKVRCMDKTQPDQNDNGDNAKPNMLTKESSDDKRNTSDEIPKEHIVKERHDEIKIVLLGAAGSGKSFLGNVLLGIKDKKEGFKTSCYAKPETKLSVLKSTSKTINRKNGSETYIINIIDTPAILDSGLTDEEVNTEMIKAKELSSKGIQAILLCIPSISLANYFTDDIVLYEKYFSSSLYGSAIVVFTRNDQFETSDKVINKNGILNKFKNQLVVKKDNAQTMQEIIEIILEMEEKKRWFWRIRSWINTDNRTHE